MSDLDQLLADTFERRAAAAPVGLTPRAVQQAIHRQRVRTAKLSAATIAMVGLAGAGLMAGLSHDAGRPAVSGPVRPPVTDPATTQDGTIVEELPWAGTTAISLRRGTVEDRAGYALCVADVCSPLSPPSGSVVVAQQFTLGDIGSVYGLAPVGTRKVLVAVGAEPPVSIPVSAADDPALPGVLYGDSSISALAPGPGAFSRTYRLSAYDSDNHKLASELVVGSADLARAHVPAGRLAVLPSYAVDPALKQVAWTDNSGWACAGERATSGASVTLGAFSCIPAHNPAQVALVAEDNSNQYVVLRVPTSVASAELRGQTGQLVRATLTDTGHGRLAVFDLSVGVPFTNSTITGRNGSGAVVFAAPMNSLSMATGSVTAQ